MEQEPFLSIVIPVFNERDNILPLAEEIEFVMGSTAWSWECLWVDDGSNDGTSDQLQAIHNRNSCHNFICHTLNYGQSAALYTGFIHAKGEIIVTLDGDGQNDPGDIPLLVNRLLEEDLDMVNGLRNKREDSFVRKISSRIANGFRNWMTHEQIMDVGCSLRALRRQAVEHIPVFKGMHRFLPTLVKLSGHEKILELPVGHRPRKHGQTKYGIHNRLWVGIMDTMAVRWMQRRLVYPEIKISTMNKGRGGEI